MEIRVLVIDDERLARKELITLLSKYEHVVIVDESSDADEAILKINQHQPDLVFLDIQMPGKSGFEVLEEIAFSPEVIFITAYDEFAIKAFEVNALDYILKPIDEKRLHEAILKIENILKEQQTIPNNVQKLNESNQIFIKDGEKCWFVQLSKIKMFESVGNYAKVYFDDNKPMILKSLNNLEQRLDERFFFRANRKYIINLSWIEHTESADNGGLLVRLRQGETIEISRRQSAKLRDMLSL
jgi:two-component system, LytTR family, response regulator